MTKSKIEILKLREKYKSNIKECQLIIDDLTKRLAEPTTTEGITKDDFIATRNNYRRKMDLLLEIIEDLEDLIIKTDNVE